MLLGFLMGMAVRQVGEVEEEASLTSLTQKGMTPNIRSNLACHIAQEVQEDGTPWEVMVTVSVALRVAVEAIGDQAGEEEAIRSQMMASSTTSMKMMISTSIAPRKTAFTGDLGVGVGRGLEEVV